MVEVIYDFDIEGALSEDPFLDRYEITVMFEQTRESIGKGIQRKLEGIACAEHEAAPKITITGRYDAGQEEFDIQYHIDTCCPIFMAQVIKTLNSIN